MTLETKLGRSSPQGATVVDGGVNFSLFSRLATGAELLLFDQEDATKPAHHSHPRDKSHVSLLALVCAGNYCWTNLRLPGAGTVDARAWPALRRNQGFA